MEPKNYDVAFAQLKDTLATNFKLAFDGGMKLEFWETNRDRGVAVLFFPIGLLPAVKAFLDALVGPPGESKSESIGPHYPSRN